MRKLKNGAVVIASAKGFVLARFRGQYVTWGVGGDGDAYWGHYYDGIALAAADYEKRVEGLKFTITPPIRKPPAFVELTNEQRASRARAAIERYSDPDDVRTSVVDVLTDLRHLCHQQDIGWPDAVDISNTHFVDELREEGEA